MSAGPPPVSSEGPIRICIDARPMAGVPCGFTVYLGSVIRCLDRHGFELTLLSNRPLDDRYEDANGIETRVFGSDDDFKWEQKDLVGYLDGADADIFFTGANRGIPYRKNKNVQYILSLLDIIPYKFFKVYFIGRWRERLGMSDLNKEAISQLISVFRADAILTISKHSAADIRRFFRRKNVSARLINLRPVDKPEDVCPKRQFAYLGGTDFRKKTEVLLEAFARFRRAHPGYELILVGSNYQQLQERIEALGIQRDVRMTGYVDHQTKFRILAESIAMIYPSLYEGYGMAIAEGIQAGIPIIAGRGGSQEEIGGRAARFIDPSSPGDIAAAMEEMLDPRTRDTWVARGKEQLDYLTSPSIETDLVRYFADQAQAARSRRNAGRERRNVRTR